MTWGGGERWHLDVAKYLQSNGHSVILYVRPGSELASRAQMAGLPIRQLQIGKYSYLNPLKVANLRNVLARDRVHTLIMNLSSDMKVGALAARNGLVNRVIYRRGSAIPIKNTLINRWILNRYVSEILANSQATAETIFANNHKMIDPDRVVVIPNGVDIPPSDQLRVRPDSQHIRIGNVGRLYKQKGQHYLIDLANELRRRELDFVIEIAGEGVERDNITQLIANNRLDKEVKLIGFRRDLEDFYQSIDIFVLTSLWEGFGYVLAEAMSHGVPTVAYDLSSNPELIVHGHNGQLVPLGDITALADSIQSIIADHQNYSRAARQSMQQYAKPIILSKIETYLLDGMDKRTGMI